MASAAAKIGLVMPVVAPAAVGALGFALWRINWASLARALFASEGRTTRLLVLASVLLNLKCLPLAWTVRVWNALIYHNLLRPSPPLTPRSLFAPIVTSSHVSLLEVDYNIHKSNSTYFADLDVSRSHLVMYLCRTGFAALRANATTRLVLDPRSGEPFRGKPGIMLGAVHCSFRREIAPYASYEMWSRILAWDRKWVYIATHFVPKGVAKPTEWLDPRFGLQGLRKGGEVNGEKEKEKEENGWENKVYASAVSKYVFKLGRLTVHPALVLGASGLLPERPGGWVRGDEEPLEAEQNGTAKDETGGDAGWTWQRAEERRRRGMELAAHFQAMEGGYAFFDGGDDGALGKF